MKDWTGNVNSVFKTIGASNHTGNDREQDDYYATDPKAIDKLLTVEHLSNYIWECACGEGHLSKRLRETGHFYIMSSDIVRRNDECTFVADFLKLNDAPGFTGIDKFDIITNPPYKYAKEFVLKALDLLPHGCRCYMLLKLTFLEGKARFEEIFSKTPPKAVYAFSERIQCAKNGEFNLHNNGAVAYAWYVWQKGWTGLTTLDWI